MQPVISDFSDKIKQLYFCYNMMKQCIQRLTEDHTSEQRILWFHKIIMTKIEFFLYKKSGIIYNTI